MLRLLRSPACRRFSQVPFDGDLAPADDHLFNLQDFQHYREAPEVRALREKAEGLDLAQFSRLQDPAILTSRLQNPYLNLAIEDYVYNRMPAEKHPADRLFFYTNAPCVVVGKNQNPWQEVNMPALASLGVPLVRRRSGGGTVVHDTGNVNFCYMTAKDNFDRFRFAQLICRAINPSLGPDKQVSVNARGDIVTQQGAFKVSGSAYKLSRGRSYHHGTMLLNSQLDVLRQLLHRDERAVGCVQSTAAISSVRSPVTNLHLASDRFMGLVAAEFRGDADLTHFTVESEGDLPDEVLATADKLRAWDWRYGGTPRFSHVFTHEASGFSVTFEVGKGALVQSVALQGASAGITEAFQYLDAVLRRGDQVQYTGSNVAGFVLDDDISEWLGASIDGTS